MLILKNRFYNSQKENLKIAEEKVLKNEMSSFAAAFELLEKYFSSCKN